VNDLSDMSRKGKQRCLASAFYQLKYAVPPQLDFAKSALEFEFRIEQVKIG
jgi:hypothetical protein